MEWFINWYSKENEPRTTFRYGFQPGWVATSDNRMSSYDSKDWIVSNILCFAISFSWTTVIVSRLTSWRTRLRSVLNVNDLIIRIVSVADVFGRATFVSTSSDMVRKKEGGSQMLQLSHMTARDSTLKIILEKCRLNMLTIATKTP